MADFYSESYHESLKNSRTSVGDPISLHWENFGNFEQTYAGNKRFSLNGVKSTSKKVIKEELFSLIAYSSTLMNKIFTQLQNDVSSDNLDSVAIYAYIQGQTIPDDLYRFDKETSELISLTQVQAKAKKNQIENFINAFANNEYIKESSITLFFVGVLDRAVWRFKESSYRELELDVGSFVGLTSILAKSIGSVAIPLGSFVDDEVAYALNLSKNEVPLAAVAIMPKYLKTYEMAAQFAYSNRSELKIMEESSESSTAIARFLLQNKAECITDLSKCMKVCRIVNQPFEGEEFPLTPLKFPNEYFFKEYGFLGPGKLTQRTFKKWNASLDDFSTILRWMEICTLNAFGAGLLKIWVLCFDVQLVYPGVYRYLPLKKSLYMHSNLSEFLKYKKSHLAEEVVENAAFAVVFTANLNEACNIMGDRAFRYLNMNAGYVAEMLRESARGLGKLARREMFYCEDELKRICKIYKEESILCEVLVGK